MTSCDREIINIGADNDIELIQVASMLKEIAKDLGYVAEIEFAEARVEVKNAYCNHDKAKKLLGFEDKTDIEELIREMFEWAIGQPKQKVKQFEYEIEKNMYSYWKK